MEITREIVLPTTREDAWEALTDPERLEEWFANEVSLELREGGTAEFRWADGAVRRGSVATVREEELLVLRFDDESVVELTLTEAVGGTAVHVRETAPEWSTALEITALAWAHA